MKPRLSSFSWRFFASTYPLMLSPSSHKKFHSACLPFPRRNQPSFSVKLPFFTPGSRSDPSLSSQGGDSAHLDTLPFHDFVIWTNSSFSFPFGKGGYGVPTSCCFYQNCSLCSVEAIFFYSEGPLRSSFSTQASSFSTPAFPFSSSKTLALFLLHFSLSALPSISHCCVSLEFLFYLNVLFTFKN